VKFLVDMGLGRATVVFLRESGHDAVHLRDRGLQRLGDDGIIALALAEERIILTHDLDFNRIVALSGGRAPGVITFRLTDMRSSEVNRYIVEVLSRFDARLQTGAMVSVTESSIRVRSLPITMHPG
jgi:predicted nuclease of predicted toxin-antitoxin system